MNMQKLYHYTDEKGARGILRSGSIEATSGIRGSGVYLTALGPKTDPSRLLQNNYDDSHRVVKKSSEKVSFWFSFYVDDFGNELERVVENDRSVYVVGRRVNLNEGNVKNWTNFDDN